MKRIVRVAALAVMVTGASCLFMGASGCGSELHKASVAAASIGASVQTAANVNHDLIQAQLETPDEGAMVATYILKVTRANDVFVADLKAVQASGGQLTSAQVMTDFSAVVNSVDALQNAGILGLKNPAAKAKFDLVMASIREQVAIIQAVLGTQTAHGPRRNRLPGPPGALPMLGLALTAEEIEELIALALAAGSALASKLMSLRGESDPQLLNDAMASDAAAEAQAIADGGKI